jgi:hypothetical protein
MLMLHPRHGAAQRRARARDGRRHSRQYRDEHDFMLHAAELNPLIKILRANGIEVASVHNHMLDGEPPMIFMHFWAHGDAVDLAKGLKAALLRIGA